MKLIQIETARDRRITYEKHACSCKKNNLDSVASVKIRQVMKSSIYTRSGVHHVFYYFVCTWVIGEDKQDQQVRLGVENGSCFVFVYI